MKEGYILNRIAEATMSYYRQLTPRDLTEADFTLWIESLQEPMKAHFKNQGLDHCRGVLNFQRHSLELRGIGLDEYLKNQLTAEEYSHYLNPSSTEPTSINITLQK